MFDIKRKLNDIMPVKIWKQSAGCNNQLNNIDGKREINITELYSFCPWRTIAIFLFKKRMLWLKYLNVLGY
jgi:hypothetical protein